MRMVDLIANRLGFTAREAQVFWLLATFTSDKARIAERLDIREAQVTVAIRAMMRKTGAASPVDLIGYARVCVQQKVGPLVLRKEK